MRVAVIGAGEMGSAIGALLVARGAEVLSPLADRSAASRERAARAGMRDASWVECAACDFVLSVVPSSQALPVARRLLNAVAGGNGAPVYLDCNPVTPDGARSIGTLLEAGGVAFVDAGIVGGPPAPDGARIPLFYLSGPDACRCTPLAEHGLALEYLDGPIGAASALKLAIAGVSKGQTGLFAAMALLAAGEGVAGPFLAKLSQSQPAFYAWGTRQGARLGATAGRWAEEMVELRDAAAAVPGASDQFGGLEELFTALAQDRDGAAARLSELLASEKVGRRD